MERFSDRIKIPKPVKSIQVDSMSDELKTSLWNVVHKYFERERRQKHWNKLSKFVSEHFSKTPIDELSIYDNENRDWVKEYFYSLDWWQVYDLIEAVSKKLNIIKYGDFQGNKETVNYLMQRNCNLVLERELSGYRFISGILTPISNEAEVASINEALQETTEHGLLGANEHLLTALSLLSKKPVPEYRNVVKEAISAVESIVKQISGVPTGGLDNALEELSKKTEIHGALKTGFRSLYGYSSQEDGIRHAILDPPNVGYDEAKFMLVSCSAFVHFLVAKASSAGLLSV